MVNSVETGMGAYITYGQQPFLIKKYGCAFFQNYNLKKAQLVNLDIGYGDPITPEPIKTKIASILEGNDISWRIYPIETSIAEKLYALVARQSFNSRSKDIFDLYVLLPCDVRRPYR